MAENGKKERRTVAVLRAEKGVSLQALAEQTGIPFRTLRMIDRKHYLASPDQVRLISEALGVTPDDLDIGTPETQPGTWGTGGTYS